MSEIKCYAREWVPISEQPPGEGVYLIIHEPLQCVSVARYWTTLGGAPKWTDNVFGQKVFEPTHWRSLPEPPRRESSFNQWSNQFVTSFQGRLQVDEMGVYPSTAKLVWDAAVAASKRPDFVP